MKTLVIYCSRTGNTRKVGHAVATALGCDEEEIIDGKDRSRISGYLGAGRDATLQRATPIQAVQKNAAEYDLVVVGTPIWAFTVSSPVRTFLTEHGRNIKSVAFFCTMGGSGDERAFRHMEELCGKPPVATLALTEKEVVGGGHHKIEDYVAVLRGVK